MSDAFQFISSQTASNSASITFNGLTSSYAYYQVIITNMVPVTNAVSLNMQINGNSGVSSYQYSLWEFTSGGGTGAHYSTGASSIVFNAAAVSNSSPGASFTVDVFNPSAATYCTVVYAGLYLNGTALTVLDGSGIFDGAGGPNTSISFFCSSGNISSGNFYLYGALNT